MFYGPDNEIAERIADKMLRDKLDKQIKVAFSFPPTARFGKNEYICRDNGLPVAPTIIADESRQIGRINGIIII